VERKKIEKSGKKENGEKVERKKMEKKLKEKRGEENLIKLGMRRYASVVVLIVLGSGQNMVLLSGTHYHRFVLHIQDIIRVLDRFYRDLTSGLEGEEGHQ